MKKSILLLSFVLSSVCFFNTPAFADYTDEILTDSSELIFSVKDNYDVIEFIEGYTTEEVGAPQLPVKIVKFVIPINVNVSNIIINNSSYQQLSGTFSIYPYQQPSPLDGSDPHPFVEPDSLIYNSNTPYPGKLIEIAKDIVVFGYHIITLRIFPIEYIPLQKKINLFTEISFTIEYETNNVPFQLPEKQSNRRYRLVKSYIKNSVKNPYDFETITGGVKEVMQDNISTKGLKLNFLPTIEGDIPDYIIITNEELKPYFNTLAMWKIKKGIPTIIVTTNEIAGNYSGCDLAEKIRNYLKDACNKWGFALYVLLGGDSDIIPARIGTKEGTLYRVTDMYYCDVYKPGEPDYNWNSNGDNEFGYNGDTGITLDADNIIGRASVEDTIEAQTFVNKILYYEKQNNDYINNVLLIGAFHSNNSFPNGQQWHNYVYHNILPDTSKAWRIFDDHTTVGNNLYPGDEELNAANVLAALNDGGNSGLGYFHIVSHYDHSNPYIIGTSAKTKNQSINRTDIDSIYNSPFYQIMYSAGCDPNEFQKDCFGEHYINNPHGCGVAFIGNSGFGWPGNSAQCYSFFSSIYLSGDYYLGFAFSNARDAIADQNVTKNLNLLGDPEMPIWTNTPDSFIVSYTPDTITNVNNHLTVTVGNLTDSIDVTVCLYKENEAYAYQTIFSSGTQEVFDFDIAPNTPGNLDITVTAHNYIPYEDLIYISETIINDSTGGNGDLQADAGEKIELSLALTNSGDLLAQNIYAILMVDTNYTNYVTILEDSSGFNNINPSDTLLSLSNYVFTLTADTPHAEQLKLDFSIYDGDSTYTDECYIQIGAPELEQDNKLFSTSNSDNIIEPGETVSLYIGLFNSGNAEATGITATLISTDPYIETITDSIQNYSNITPLSSDTNLLPFVFTVSSAYSVGNTLNFTLTVTNEYGKIWTFPFNLDRPTDTLIADFTSELTEIDLNWNPLTGIKGYNVYRSDADINGNPVGIYEKLNTFVIEGSAYYEDLGLQELTAYYYKISIVSLSGMESDISLLPALKAWTTLSYYGDWPVTANASTGVQSSPTVADLDKNGQKEVFINVTSGCYIMGYHSDGTELYDIDNNPTTVSGFVHITDPNTELWSSPAIGDIDGDGIAEVVVASRYNDTFDGRLYAFNTVDTDTFGQPGYGKPDPLSWSPIPLYCQVMRSPVLSDLDNNGKMEIIVTDEHEWVYVFDHTGVSLPGWPKQMGTDYYSMGGIAVADLDNDGDKEIVVGSKSGLFVWHHDGSNFLTSNPFFNNGTLFVSQPVIVDIDNDNEYEIFTISSQSGSSIAQIYAFNPDGTPLDTENYKWGGENTITINTDYMPPSVAVGDLNNDGDIEVIVGGKDMLYAWDHEGNPLPGFHVSISNLNAGDISPVLADIDTDDDIEIIMASGSGKIYAFNYDGTEITGWRLTTADHIVVATPVVSDIDNNGKNEILIGNGTSSTYIWETGGNANKIEWGSFRHDCFHTGLYGTFDLYMKDYAEDSGIEPVPDSIWWIWMSEDIWVRHQNDSIEEHQNPEYDSVALTPNYVFVKVRNRGNITSFEGNLHIYWTRARTGEIWPDHWLADTANQTAQGNPYGAEITTDTLFIPPIPPGDSVVLGIEWSPPNPDWYNYTDSITMNNWPMICLLARIESVKDPMTNEADGPLGPNIRRNNNIITKNTYVSFMEQGKVVLAPVSVNINNAQSPSEFELIFESHNEPSVGEFTDWGQIIINLGADIYRNWVNHGSHGYGFTPLPRENSIQVTGAKVSLQGITLDQGEQHEVSFNFELDKLSNP
ncbi:MAG: VCBS repeat-containing protein, partial [Bacteroidia bacterium]|nr:VCBS repeat-containing protein [Bacteroidia bacterium]